MFRDVRMRGFQRRTSVQDAQAWVDALGAQSLSAEGACPQREAEDVEVQAAAGRVLAADVVSAVDVPAFPRAAMDGWALRAEETFGAAETDPISLQVVGTSLPGHPYGAVLARGQAIRIMTGAPVPAGADAVLRAEDGHQDEERLAVRAALPVHLHVGAVGEDIEAGHKVLRAGRTLRPADLGLLSSIGRGRVPVMRRPRVAILATGDELLAPGAMPDGASIVDANTPMLAALVTRDGGRVHVASRLPDVVETLRAALQQAAEVADVVLVTGGSSVGQEDHAPRLLHELGELAIHGIGMRPAAPTGMGRLGAATVFLLPGNPVSCLSAYDFFAGRRIHALTGATAAYEPYRHTEGRLCAKIASVLGRVDYVRVQCREEGVRPLMARGASILSSVTEADGFVLVPQDHEGYEEGTQVRVWLY
jgi:molybdopterin molybdotransferase